MSHQRIVFVSIPDVTGQDIMCRVDKISIIIPKDTVTEIQLDSGAIVRTVLSKDNLFKRIGDAASSMKPPHAVISE